MRLLCAIGAVLMASTMNAKVGSTFTEGDFKYKVLTEETFTENGVTSVVSGTVSANTRVTGADFTGDYVFPSTVNHDGVEYVITSIGKNLFNGYSGMTSITIPSTVTVIGEGAFGYTDIEEINIPNSVTEIGNLIVTHCANLKTIKIGKGLKTIGHKTYNDMSESLIYNEIIREANDGSQGFCPMLENIIVDPENPYFCSYDGDMYSKDMTTLVMVGKHSKGDVVVNSSVTNLYNAVFFATNITSLTLPDGLTILPRQLCAACYDLTQVNIPTGCKYIANECFINCTSLPRIELPAGVEIIDGNAFKNCVSFREIKIPNSCTKIGYMAFSGCEQFTHVTLPSRLEYFGPSFLYECNKITEITIPATMNVDLTASSSYPSVNTGNLKAIYIMGDEIPDFILYSNNDWKKGTIYVKKSVYNSLYPEGKVTKTISYKSVTGKIVTKEVTCENIGWMVPITMGTAADQDGVNYKTLCRDFDADFTDPEATESECRPFYAADVNYERTWVAMQQMRYVPCRTLANVDGYKGVDAYHGVVVEGLPGKTYYYRIGEDDYTLGAEGQTLLTSQQEDNMMRGANDDHWTYIYEQSPKTGEDMTNYGLKDNKFRIFTQIGWLNYNKSYLSIPTEVANAKALSLAFEREDGTTRVVSAESFAKACDDGSVFNIQGQKVTGNYKGIVIKNGKKLFISK